MNYKKYAFAVEAVMKLFLWGNYFKIPRVNSELGIIKKKKKKKKP